MAVEREYRVTISGVLSRSTAAAFGEMIADATRAKKKIDEILGAPSKGVASAAKAEGKARVDEAQKAARELEQIRERENNAILRDVEKVARAKEKAAREEQALQEKLARATAARNQKIASDALGYMRKAAGQAARVAGEVVSGLGIDMSLQGGVAKAVNLEKMAVAIVNAGNRGNGSAAQRNTEVTSLQTTARDIADKYKIDATQVLSGLGQYQALTGDLDTAKVGLEGLARLSKAFNVDLDKMVGAAGQVGSAIGEVGKEFASPEEKANAILNVLKQATAQGQEGAIEISDLATQYAKLKAAGMRFEGNTGDNISKMSALAQLAYQTGGAGSIREASNAVMGFVNTLNTPARRKEFKALGIDLENDKGQFLDPYQLIKQSLAKTGGDTEKMNALFKNVVGYKAVSSFVSAYKGAGGGEAGMKAVDAQFARFGGKVSDATIEENLKRALETKESKAQEFQNRIDRITSYMADRLIPALEGFAGPAEKGGKMLAEMVASAAEHPWGTIATVIATSVAASIAKAAIGEMAGKAFASALGSLGPGGIAVGALAATAVTGYIYLKKSFDEGHEGQTAGVETQLKAGNAGKLARDAAAGRVSKEEALKQLEATYAAGTKQVKLAEKGVGFFDYINPFGDATNKELGAAQELAAGGKEGAQVGGKTELDALKANLVDVKTAIESLKAQMAVDAQQTKKVMVVNQAPGAPTAGTVAQ